MSIALSPLSWKEVGAPNTPQEIKRLRRQNMDAMRRTGEPVVHMHRWNIVDEQNGIAKDCPACYDARYGSTRADCQVCYGVRFVSVENDPEHWIDSNGLLTTDPTDLPAPLYGGYGDPHLTWMVEPDTSVDVFMQNNQGFLVNTQQAQGFAPWFPKMGDNDLVINVLLGDDDYTITFTDERYELKKVNPQTVRGLGRRANFQDFIIGQTFEMARIPTTRIQYLIDPRKHLVAIDSDIILSLSVITADDIHENIQAATVTSIASMLTLEAQNNLDAAMVTAVAIPSGGQGDLYGHIDSGTVIAVTVPSGADIHATTDAGTIISGAVISAVDAHGYPDAATVTSVAIISSGDIYSEYIDAATVTAIAVITDSEQTIFTDNDLQIVPGPEPPGTIVILVYPVAGVTDLSATTEGTSYYEGPWPLAGPYPPDPNELIENPKAVGVAVISAGEIYTV